MVERQENTKENENFLQETCEDRWRTYRKELTRCQVEPSEEAVHDIRVAIRRLLVCLKVVHALVPHKTLQKARRTLKGQLDDLDNLRDTQVMLIEVKKVLVEFPGIEPFLKYLEKREEDLLQLSEMTIKSFNCASVRKRLDKIRNYLLELKTGADRNNLILGAVDDQFKTLMSRVQLVDPQNPKTIHRVRIAFKIFRYMIEIIHPLVPNYPENNFKLMRGYQTAMGNIQDADVLLSTFNQFAEKNASYHTQPVLPYDQKHHNELISAFSKEIPQFNIFWRSAPDVPFPWE